MRRSLGTRPDEVAIETGIETELGTRVRTPKAAFAQSGVAGASTAREISQ